MFKKSHKSYDKYFIQRTPPHTYIVHIYIYILIYVRFMPYLLKMRYAFVIRLFFCASGSCNLSPSNFLHSLPCSRCRRWCPASISSSNPRDALLLLSCFLCLGSVSVWVCKSNINWHLKAFNGHMERTAKCFPSYPFIFFLIFFFWNNFDVFTAFAF